MGLIERSPKRIALVVDDQGRPLVGARPLRDGEDVPEGRVPYVRADLYQRAADVLREIDELASKPLSSVHEDLYGRVVVIASKAHAALAAFRGR